MQNLLTFNPTTHSGPQTSDLPVSASMRQSFMGLTILLHIVKFLYDRVYFLRGHLHLQKLTLNTVKGLKKWYVLVFLVCDEFGKSFGKTVSHYSSVGSWENMCIW